MKPGRRPIPAFALALLAFGTAPSCAPRGAGETIESDWIELDAGAATLRLRFTLDHRALVAHGELVNRQDTPIWWRDFGRTGKSFPRAAEPIDATGQTVPLPSNALPVFHCWEDNDPVTPRQLAGWRLDPGESRSFFLILEQATDPDTRTALSRLAHTVHEGDFTLARATRPPRSVDFQAASLRLTWHRTATPEAVLLPN